MKHKVNEKRLHLIQLSKGLDVLKKSGAIDTVNEGLIKTYTNEQHQYYKSYKQWQAEDLQVKKGEKAFLLLGCPKNINKKTETKPQETTTTDKENNFFPIAFIFSNAQVEPKGDKNNG